MTNVRIGGAMLPVLLLAILLFAAPASLSVKSGDGHEARHRLRHSRSQDRSMCGFVSYLTGSHRAIIDGGFLTSALSSGKRRIAWKFTWAPGVATSSAIEVAVILIDTLADTTSTAANTICRAILARVNKGENDTLELTWNHDLLGA